MQIVEREGRRFAIGDKTCPSPALCDQRDDDRSFRAYMIRHLEDHQIEAVDHDTGVLLFPEPADLKRNLGLNCLFFYAKYIQGNASLGTGKAIVAHYEPCWEDAAFLSCDTFHPDDLEQNTSWESRTFRLKPFAEQRQDGRLTKRHKKLTKVRRTQKTSWAKAYISWEHLRAYFLFDNRTLRVLVMSCNKGMARDNYFEPIKTMWSSHAELQQLFGTTEYTAKYQKLLARRESGKFVAEEDLEAETRQLCLIARGSRASVDRMRLRWNVADKAYSGMTAVSLCCAGANSSTQGGRWDIIVVDDAADRKNTRTTTQRKKLRESVAELRKQLTGAGRIVYLNTPQNAGDVSDVIDKEQGDQYHIMYRPAMWYDAVTKEPHYYWQFDAIGEELWTPAKIDAERKEPDFYSQILLRLRDASQTLFEREHFRIVDISEAPLEIRAGFGGSTLSDRERAEMQREGLRVTAVTFVDGAGDEERMNGDDTAIVSWRFTRYGDMYITDVRGGRLDPEQEALALFEAWQRNVSEAIYFEFTGDKKKYARATHLDFQRRKSDELKTVIVMPIIYDNRAKSQMSKGECIDRMFTYTSTGRVFILRQAGTQEKIDTLIEQFCERPTPHDDYADASSKVVPFVQRVPTKERPKDHAKSEPINGPSNPTARVSVKKLLAEVDAASADPPNWGARGGRAA